MKHIMFVLAFFSFFTHATTPESDESQQSASQGTLFGSGEFVDITSEIAAIQGYTRG